MKKSLSKRIRSLREIKNTGAKVIVIMGAGDIGELVDPLKEKMLEEIA